jgi:hypothetical protein
MVWATWRKRISSSRSRPWVRDSSQCTFGSRAQTDRVGLQKSDDDRVYAAGVKSQMQRMDPAFKEKSLGFTTFREFVESRSDQVVSKAGTNGQLAVRLA